MGANGRSRARTLGIASFAAALSVPAQALAATDAEVMQVAATTSAVGAAVGCVLAGTVGIVALRSQRARYEAELAAAVAEATPHAPSHGRRREAAPTHEGGSHFRTVAAPSAKSTIKVRRPEPIEETASVPMQPSVEAPRRPWTPQLDNPYLAAVAETDYVAVAAEYLDRKNFKARMLSRAKGVAQVLSERMGSQMMDGMPVIERADGSVGDVGTSWWDEDMRGRPEQRPIEMQAVSETRAARPAAPSETQVAVVSPRTPTAASSPAAAASSTVAAPALRRAPRIPYVEQEAFPEIRRPRASAEDAWDLALRALDERTEDAFVQRRVMGAPAPAQPSARPGASPRPHGRHFHDAVGAVDTLDEPDGLEQDTRFMTFKAPGNHPEVQDTGSYINYLVQDEFRRNPSKQVRAQARRYFRVHDGGTDTLRAV